MALSFSLWEAPAGGYLLKVGFASVPLPRGVLELL